MADFIPTELTKDMLKAGVDAFKRMIPGAEQADLTGLEDVITVIWAACATAYDKSGREQAIWDAMRDRKAKH